MPTPAPRGGCVRVLRPGRAIVPPVRAVQTAGGGARVTAPARGQPSLKRPHRIVVAAAAADGRLPSAVVTVRRPPPRPEVPTRALCGRLTHRRPGVRRPSRWPSTFAASEAELSVVCRSMPVARRGSGRRVARRERRSVSRRRRQRRSGLLRRRRGGLRCLLALTARPRFREVWLPGRACTRRRPGLAGIVVADLFSWRLTPRLRRVRGRWRPALLALAPCGCSPCAGRMPAVRIQGWDRGVFAIEAAAQRAKVGDEDAVVSWNDTEDYRLATEVVQEVSGELRL